jgi:hypothetical protein
MEGELMVLVQGENFDISRRHRIRHVNQPISTFDEAVRSMELVRRRGSNVALAARAVPNIASTKNALELSELFAGQFCVSSKLDNSRIQS